MSGDSRCTFQCSSAHGESSASEGSRVVGRGRSRRSPPRPASRAGARASRCTTPDSRQHARLRDGEATSRLRRHGSDARGDQDARARAARGGAHRQGAVEGMGPVPERAAVGHGARGLQPGRRRLELLLPRPGAVARLPVGRGRHRRDLRRAPAAVPRARAVERRRSDPEGADVRPHQQPRATTARTSRSTGSTSTAPRRTPT